MGRVVVAARMENLADLFDVANSRIGAEQVRRVEVPDALVDTAATTLSVPKRLIDQLGLTLVRQRMARTSAGAVLVRVWGTVKLTIQGRDCPTDVIEVPDDCPVLIGQIPLEAMDWVVDPVNRRVIGNPEHGGEHVLELY